MRILLDANVLIAAYRETGQADEYSSVAAPSQSIMKVSRRVR